MAKKPEITQDEPTRPRPETPAGLQLDEHGLPVNGPSRAAALDGKPDPALAHAEPAPAIPTAPPAPQQD